MRDTADSQRDDGDRTDGGCAEKSGSLQRLQNGFRDTWSFAEARLPEGKETKGPLSWRVEAFAPTNSRASFQESYGAHDEEYCCARDPTDPANRCCSTQSRLPAPAAFGRIAHHSRLPVHAAVIVSAYLGSYRVLLARGAREIASRRKVSHPGVSGDMIPWKDLSHGTSQQVSARAS